MSEAGYRMYEKEARDLQNAKPLAYKCDTQALKQWLGRRKSSLEQVRQEFEPLWKDIRLYFEPNIGKALLDNRDRDDAASRREDEKILNSSHASPFSGTRRVCSPASRTRRRSGAKSCRN